MRKKRWSVDIVVPYGPTSATRPGALGLVLRALSRLEGLDRIVLVCNGDIPESQFRELRLICQDPLLRVTILEQHHANLSSARNKGAAVGSSNYLIFCDADILVSPRLLEILPKVADMSSFITGARRRYIPLSTPITTIEQIVETNHWNRLDRIATQQPAQNAKVKYASALPSLVMQYTFVGCFGLIPRSVFENIGGFDQAFKGWGLEDVDLMRRLVQKARCVLLKDHTVWHIDHYIEPYRSIHHWEANWRHYTAEVGTRGFLFAEELLKKDRWPRFPKPWLAPSVNVNEKTLGRLTLGRDYMEALKKHVACRMTDQDVVAMLLYGSARYRATPNDLDVVSLVFPRGVHGHVCYNSSVVVEEKQISFHELRSRIAHPGRNPDSWLVVLSRFQSRWLLSERLRVKFYLDQVITEAVNAHAYHLLTYHVGNLIPRGEPQAYVSGRDLHLAALISISRSIFPESVRPPFFSNKLVEKQLISCSTSWRHRGTDGLREALHPVITAILTKWNLSIANGKALYPASARGYDLLRGWGYHLVKPSWQTVRYGKE